jgi:phage baseplate assembly protein W
MASPRSRAKAFLGVGWAFPIKPQDGRLRYAEHENSVEQAILIILQTGRGERVMLPQFGAGLRSYVFEPNGAATHRALEGEVRNALVDWEPRIDLKKVEVRAGDEPNLLLIQIDYVVRATNTFYNRVFPFYLLESKA